jgi:cytochrome c553
MSARLLRWGAPVTFATIVVFVGLTLITVLSRAPDTRGNFQEERGDYGRTELGLIGIDDQYEGLSTEFRTDAQTYLGAGCAGCHGLSGEGGVVGPDIWKTNAQDMLDAVRNPDGGMPAFDAKRLSDEQIEALALYLNDLRQQKEAVGASSSSGSE